MAQEEMIDREEVARKNYDGLVTVMVKHNFSLNARDFHKWRPTVPTSGRIPGVFENVICIATNGLLGQFHKEGTTQAFEAHVQHFMWDNAIISMVPYYDQKSRRMKYFQNVRDQGAPSTLFAREKKKRQQDEVTEYELRARNAHERVKSPSKASREAQELLKQLLESQIK